MSESQPIPIRGGRSATRRQFLAGAGALIAGTALPISAAELLVACGGGGGAASGGATSGGHLVNGVPADATNLLPAMTADVTSQGISALMFTPPVRGFPDGSYAPALAEAMPAIASDKQTFTFRLRSGLRWNDGRPLTAQDVVFTYRLFYDPAYEKVNSPFRSQWAQTVAAVTALDDRTVQVRTRQVYALYMDLFSQYAIVPQHVLGGLTADQINTTPIREAPTVSFGPFRFGRWDKGEQIVLQRERGYSLTPVHLDQLVFRILGDATSIANGLKTGEVDVGGVDLSLVDSLRQPSIDIVRLPSPLVYSLSFQLDPTKPASGLFADRRVRQALAYGIDRSRILKAVLFDYGDAAYSIVPASSWGHDASVSPRYDYDPQKAAQLLEAAGWSMGSSGIRSRDGRPLQFDLLYALGTSTDAGIVQAMQAQWKALGVGAGLKGVNQTELVNILSTTRDFDAAMLGFSLPGDPQTPFSLLLSSAARQPGGFNITGYVNPQIDQGLAQGAQLLDRAQRKPIYDRLQRIVAEDAPLVPLFSPQLLYAASTRARGLAYHQGVDLSRAYVTDGR